MERDHHDTARLWTYDPDPGDWKKITELIPKYMHLYGFPENRRNTRRVIPVSEKKSPLARLVLFMVCLSIAGVLISGVYTYTVELPLQKSLTKPPTNGNEVLTACLAACDAKYWRGTTEGVIKCSDCYTACVNQYLYG